MLNKQQIPHIIVIGGGAGGLELVTRLGNSLGKKQLAKITLVDATLTHVWKPLWHEVAAGTLTSGEDELNYIVHGYQHHFDFKLGRLSGLQRQQKKITLAPVQASNGEQILPERQLNYDILVIAIGSMSHDFGVAGVKNYCYFLDDYASCQQFHLQFLKNLVQLQEQQSEFTIGIVGGGATGVELAAELHYACKQALHYKHQTSTELKVQISIIETAPRILAALPEKISAVIRIELARRNIKIYENERVVKVDADNLQTQSGLTIPATLKIWAAGIKAPEILATLGLETNSRNQLLVKQNLQTTFDEAIFAFGDCASCPQSGDYAKPVPPRAQAAHQQAALLAKSLARHIKGKSLLNYYYRDYGSLISLSRSNTFGNLMGRALGNLMLEGKLARLGYLYLYRQHQAALHGWWKVILLALAQWLSKPVRSRLKLH